MATRNEFIRGSVEMLILHLLKSGDCYGYQLTKLIRSYSDESVIVPTGSLYPSLYRLEENGYITEEKRQVGKRLIRTYYHLEQSGREYLDELVISYRSTNAGIQKIIDTVPDL